MSKKPEWMKTKCLVCRCKDVCGYLADYKGVFPKECPHFKNKYKIQKQ